MVRMEKVESRTSTKSSTPTTPIFPIMLTGLRLVVLPQSRTRDIAAHAGPSQPLQPSRALTLLNTKNSYHSLSSNLQTALLKILAVITIKVAKVAICIQPCSTSKTTFPCLKATTLLPQVLPVKILSIAYIPRSLSRGNNKS